MCEWCACVRCANVENYIQLSNATCRQLWKLCEQVPDSVKTILICNFMRKITYRAREQEKQNRKKEWTLMKKKKKKHKVFQRRKSWCRAIDIQAHVCTVDCCTFFIDYCCTHPFYHALDQRISRPVSFEASSAFLCFALSLL